MLSFNDQRRKYRVIPLLNYIHQRESDYNRHLGRLRIRKLLLLKE